MERTFKQWKELLGKDSIILVRTMMYYTAYNEDAERISSIFNLKLRDACRICKKGITKECYFPNHAYSNYLRKIVQKGMKLYVLDSLDIDLYER